MSEHHNPQVCETVSRIDSNCADDENAIKTGDESV